MKEGLGCALKLGSEPREWAVRWSEKGALRELLSRVLSDVRRPSSSRLRAMHSQSESPEPRGGATR
eukprot:4977516-Pleurochrysis_carterae.AAC.2